MAALAITNALVTYYTGYIKTLSPTSSNLIEILKSDPLPSLELIIVFVVAIPMTHVGYIFISNIFIKRLTNRENAKTKLTNWVNNTAAGLIAIFIISIIQISFLFFLAQSIAIEQINKVQTGLLQTQDIYTPESHFSQTQE